MLSTARRLRDCREPDKLLNGFLPLLALYTTRCDHAQVYRTYLRSSAGHRMLAHGERVRRVVLHDDFGRQAFLREGDSEQPDSNGRPTRTLEEGHESASTHDLSVLDDTVQFLDLRVKYEWPDGRREIEHVEVLTPHDRGAHAAAKARSGFTCYRGGRPCVGSRSAHSGRGRNPFDPDLGAEFLR